MSGNSSAVTERSFGVPDGVNNGQFGAGPVIDFFGLSSKYSKFPVDFVYPSETAIVPANIALIEGAKNTEEGKKFIAFTLSQAGQELLLEPKISRLPVLPYSALAGKIPPGYPDPAEIAKRSKVQFNADLSQTRLRGAVAVRPDRHVPPEGTAGGHQGDLRRRSQAGRQGQERQAGGTAGPGSQAGLGAAGGRQESRRSGLLAIFAGNKKDAAVNQQITQLEGEWNGRARANYERSREAGQPAAAL